MAEQFVTNNEKLDFKGIVLKHLQDILRLSQVEFRGGYNRVIVHQNYNTQEYVPDSREAYYNAVVSLADVLLPYFDSKITPKYEKYIKLLDMPNREAYKELADEIDEAYKDKEISNDKIVTYITEKKLVHARLLFRELNLLLHRIDYLKTAVFGEGEDDEMDIVEVDKQ